MILDYQLEKKCVKCNDKYYRHNNSLSHDNNYYDNLYNISPTDENKMILIVMILFSNNNTYDDNTEILQNKMTMINLT